MTKAHAFCDIDRWSLETFRWTLSGFYSALTIIKFRFHQDHSGEFPDVPTEENLEHGKGVLEVDAWRDWYGIWRLICFVTPRVLRWLCCFRFKIITTMFSRYSGCGKAVSITYFNCVFVASGIQHAKLMSPIILWSVACLAVPYFSHYLINGTIFENMLLKIKCVFWFSLQLLSETFLLLRRTERDIVVNVHSCSCKVPVFLVRF